MPDSPRDTVFISYRRDDAKDQASGIYERLRGAVGDRAEVFLDVNSTESGTDYRIQIENAIKRARVMIVVIGENWLDASKDGGWWRKLLPWLKPPRRLDDPKDLVLNEIRAALEKRPVIIIIPVLVDRARMPVGSELPEVIREMSYQHAVSLRHEQRRVDLPELVRLVLAALAEPDPLTAAPQPAVRPEKSAPAFAKVEPEPVAAPAPKPQEPSQSLQSATAPAPRRQAAPAKIVGTLAEERRKVLANLEHLHGAAVTYDPTIRKAAHLQYVTTLDADYVKAFGDDPFAKSCRSAAEELDWWRKDNVVFSREKYMLRTLAGSYLVVICLVVQFGLFNGLAWLIGEALGAIQHWLDDFWARVGKLIPGFVSIPSGGVGPLQPHINILIAAALATLLVVAICGFVVAMLLNIPFLALAGKWRIPNCDAALADVRAKLDAPPSAAKA